MRFEAFGGKQGALNGLPISTPYMTKDYLQLKRFQAQSNGTTYVYDFPDMFRQSVERQWHKFSQLHPQGKLYLSLWKLEVAFLTSCDKFRMIVCLAKLEMPGTVMTCMELVMDKTLGNVIEQKRLPGENQVCPFHAFPPRNFFLYLDLFCFVLGRNGRMEDAIAYPRISRGS